MGEEVRVKVILVDDAGRVKLSRKEAFKEEGIEDPHANRERGGGGGGGNSGGGNSGGGNSGGGNSGGGNSGGGNSGGGNSGGGNSGGTNANVVVLDVKTVIGAMGRMNGNVLNPTDTFNGKMDEFIILRRAMSSSEISQAYEAGSPY